MKTMKSIAALGLLVLGLAACKSTAKVEVATPEGSAAKKAALAIEPAVLTPEQLAAVESLGLDAAQVALLEAKPLYLFNEKEVDVYLRFVHATEPDLRARTMKIGRKNLGQPYEIYLLGEFPFESYDPQPLYCLDRSDCVVFSEHTYAMALSPDWNTFFSMLQRIRYRDGLIGVATRNHYTEADWDINNQWLVTDLSDQLAGGRVAKYTTNFNRAGFLKKRYQLDVQIPVERRTVSYIPLDVIPDIQGELGDGDFVNVIMGTDAGGEYASHTGLIAHGEDGTVHFLHSTPPQVREEPLAEYIRRGVEAKEKKRAEGKAYLKGFKFLRLNEDALDRLKAIDGDETPRVRPFPSQNAARLFTDAGATK